MCPLPPRRTQGEQGWSIGAHCVLREEQLVICILSLVLSGIELSPCLSRFQVDCQHVRLASKPDAAYDPEWDIASTLSWEEFKVGTTFYIVGF